MTESNEPLQSLQNDVPRFFVSFGGKINVGNYESHDVNWGISNIPVNCSIEFLEATITMAKERSAITLDALAQEVMRIKGILKE